MRVLVLDDHRLFLDGLCHVLTGLGNDTQITEAQSAQQALKVIDEGARYDLILADLAMPDLDGFAFLDAMRGRHVTTPVVIVSGSVEPALIRRALDKGALGFVPKSTEASELLAALRQVLDGDVYLPANLQAAVLEEPHFTSAFESDSSAVAEPIGRRQLDVLKLLAEGKSNKEIALVLNISEATVKSHIGNIFRALKVKNRTTCVREAARLNLVSLSDS